jgi:hypothetical protein
MANNYECGTVSPYFPTSIVKAHADEFPSGVSTEDSGQFTYLYVEDGCEDWDKFSEVLQVMLKEWQESDEDAPKHCYIKVAYYCDKMRQDEFGGFCTFITANNMEYCSVDGFVMECINKMEKGWLT